MKKALFIFMTTTFLVGCSVGKNRTSEDFRFVEENSSIYVVPPAEVQMQLEENDDEFLSIPEVPVKKIETAPYMDVLAKKLRKGLRSSGAKIAQVESQIDIIIPNKVVFGTNKEKVQASAEDSLTLIAQLLTEYDQTMIQIIGYTDDVGSVLRNKDISARRAEALGSYLVQKGIKAERIITDGAGSDNPVANNATSAGREENRRIEITLISLQ